MTDHRADFGYECKSFDDEQRILRGTATTPTADRVEDIVEPLGLKFGKELPLFLYHDSQKAVGTVRLSPPTKAGVDFEAQLPKVSEAGNLRDRVDEAWQMVKYGLIKAVSIGFRPVADKVERLKSGGLHYLEAEVFELSLVGVGANADARITAFKSADVPPRAPGDSRPSSVRLEPSLPLPGAHTSTKGNAMSKTAAEQIKDLESTRAAKVARHLAVMNKASDEGRSTDQNEADEVDALDAEIKALDADLVRYHRQAQFQAEQAKAVETTPEQRQFFAPSVHVKTSRDDPDKFAGQSFTRLVIAKAMGDLTRRPPSQIAYERWGRSNPTLVEILKVGEVAGGGTGTGEWGMELAKSDSRYTGDFIEFLYGMTVFDKLPLTRIPANVFVKGQDGEGIAYWVGESKAIPVTTLDFMDVELRNLKVATIAVISNQLIRYSSPDAELMVRNGLAQACAKRIDQTFLSTTAAVAGVSPAGILNGLTPIATTGTDAASIRKDIAALYAPFITARNSTGLAIVTTPALAKNISLMVNALGQPELGGTITSSGGSLLGDPVYVGDYVGTGDVILLSPKDIWRIGDTGLDVMSSREATIEQSTAPTGATDTPVAASQFITSMYQEDSTAVRILRELNFAKRRSTAVAYIDVAAYAP